MLGGLTKFIIHFTLMVFLSKLLTMFSEDYTITKRQLGILLLIIGILGVIGILAIDLLNAGQQGGIGPAQAFALGIMGVVALVGLTLIPLGDTPA